MAKKKKYEEVYEQLIQARNLNTSDEVAKAEKYVNENRPGPKTVNFPVKSSTYRKKLEELTKEKALANIALRQGDIAGTNKFKSVTEKYNKEYLPTSQKYNEEKDKEEAETISKTSEKNLANIDRYNKGANVSDSNIGKVFEYADAVKELRKEGYTIDDIKNIASGRKRQTNATEMAEKEKESAEFAAEHKVLSSILSVPQSVVGGVTGSASAAAQFILDPFRKIDTNEAAFTGSNEASAIRDEVTKDMSPLGRFIYETGMSLTDSLAGGLLGRAAKLGKAGSQVMMGSMSMENTIQDVTERGGTPEQALFSGFANGFFEGFFEEFSLGKLIKLSEGGSKGLKQIAKDIGSSVLVNASEEAATEFSSIMYDTLMNGGISNSVLKIQEYMGQGMTEEEAKSTVARDFAIQIGQAGIGGALAGGALGGAGTVAGKINNRPNDNDNKVIEKETQERAKDKRKTVAIENEVNKRISESEEVNGVLSDTEKNNIRKAVEADVESGKFDVTTTELSTKEFDEIRKQVRNDLENGKISLKRVEETLFPEKAQRFNELIEELKKADEDQRESIENELKNINNDISKIIGSSKHLSKSYEQEMLKNTAFKRETSADDTELTKLLDKSVARAGLNDTPEAHDTYNLLNKVANDSGTEYVFTSNKELEALGYNLKGRTVNGLVRTTKDGKTRVLVNIDSNNALNIIVGHETTHLLENTELYDKLKNHVIDYAKEKGDYDSRLEELTELYKDTNANVEEELVADLIGEYVFTDEAFVKNLSAKQPNIFQRIYNHIKHLIKMATAGSKEAKQLEQIKNTFDKAYKEMGKASEADSNLTTEADSNVNTNAKKKQYSLSEADSKYDSAVKSGDIETAQRLVDEAAKNAGYTIKAYHGSRQVFNEFSKDKRGGNTHTKVSNDWFFAADKETANSYYPYGVMKELARQSPNVWKDSDAEKMKQKGKLYNLYIKMENPLVVDVADYDYAAHRETADAWHEYTVQAEENGNDGIILLNAMDNQLKTGARESTVYMFKDPNQAKSAEPITYDNSGNVIPLSERFNSRKRDIRFSLSSPVEENKNLMAIHNLHANEVLKQLDLGGMPMPSMAVTDPAKVDHEGFGDITLILDKDTIDPKKSKYNKVYSGDAYTPTFPRIEYEANEAESEAVYKTLTDATKGSPEEVRRNVLKYHPGNIDDELNRWGGEAGLIESLLDDRSMKQTYLYTKRQYVEDIFKTTETKLTEEQKLEYDTLISELGEDTVRSLKAPASESPIKYRQAWIKEHEREIRDAYKTYLGNSLRSDGHDITDGELNSIIEAETPAFFYKEVRAALNYLNNGDTTVKVEYDGEATRQEIENRIDEAEYKQWLENLFKGIERKSGLRNNVDPFTRSGNRRGFDALHDPVTLDNIVKAMRGDEQQKGQGFLGGNLSGAAAQEYGSIEDIKKDSGRIGKLTEEEHKQNNKYIEDTLNEIAMRYADGKDWWDARNALVEAVAMRETKKGIKGYLKEYDYVYKLDDSIVDDLVNLRDYIRSLPVPYFEAKPQRAVGFDEVGVFVIPNNADAALKQKLLESGYSIAEYNPDIEGDRQRVVNEFEKYKFSLSKPNNDIAPVNRQGKAYVGGYAVYGSDMKRLKEEIAPIREDIQDIKNALSDLRENVAALAPEPIIAANTPDIEDIAPVREDLKHKESKEENNDAKEPEADEAPLITKTRKELRKALLEDNKDVIMNALENAKNLSSPLMNNTDTIRLSEMVFGRKAGSKINEIIFQRAIDNEAKSVAWQNKERSDIKDLGIKPRSKESAAVQKWGEGEYVNEFGDVVEYTDSDLMLEFPNVADQKRIKDAAIAMRKKYDEYIEIANNVLTGLGFKPIEKRKNYFMHFQELGDFLSKNGIPFNPQSMKENNLPTDINGLTEFFVPQKKWFASMNQRKGKRTVYDAVTGIDKYISGVADIIYHTEDIQRGRAFEELIRDTYGQGEAANANRSLLPEELQMERLKKQQDAHLSKYARWLHNWTDNLAGKKNRIDRAIEDFGDRAGFSILDTARKQVSANMIGFNLSSSLTNLIASVQAMAKTNKVAVAKGTADTIRNIVQKDDFISKNSFLTNRFGSDMLSKNWWQKAQDAGFIFMKGMDWFSANQIVRSKFYELRSKGMSEEQAHAESGKFAARIMGDRTKGANAMFYNSKLFNVVGQFQLEVNNQLYSMFYDTYHESKEKAKGDSIKTAAGITFTLGQLFVMTHIFGQTFKAVAGYNPTFDVIGIIATALGLGDDDDDNVVDNLQEAADQLLDALPYSNLMTGGGRIPLSSAIPDIGGLITGGKDNYGNDLEFSKEMAKLPYLLMPAGYGQIKKTTQGLKMFDKDNPVPGSYTDNGNLRFPVEDTPFNRIQAGLFGQWSNENAREYFDNERQPLKEKQIQEYKDLDLPIADYWKYRDGLKEQKTLEDKFNYIADLDLPVSKKNIMINNIVDREEKVDMTNYDDFSSYEEFDFATKNPEKYSFLESLGVSYKDYKSSEEAKEAYDWAYNNPDKCALAKAAAGDIVTYRNYAAALNDLKADKDSDGKTISGSRKIKVAEYINSLDADYGAKLILYKSEYKSDDQYNYEIIEYLNSRQDISYQEMVEILNTLGFVVDSQGYVRW